MGRAATWKTCELAASCVDFRPDSWHLKISKNLAYLQNSKKVVLMLKKCINLDSHNSCVKHNLTARQKCPRATKCILNYSKVIESWATGITSLYFAISFAI